MRSKLLILTMLLLSIVLAGQAFAVTATVTPSQVPKGAYVNGPNGDDNFYWQCVTITVGAINDDGETIVVTMPTGMHVANTDGDANYAEEISISHNSVAATITADAAATTANSIELDITVGDTAPNEIIHLMIPVTTDLIPAAGPYVYGVACSDGDEAALVTAPAITYRDAGALQLVSTETNFAGDNDSTSTYGQCYPASAAAMWGALPDFVKDGAGFVLTVGATMGTYVAADNNNDTDDVTYTLWAATDSTLSHVNVLTSGVTRAVRFTGGANYTMNETDAGATSAIATAALPEGNYYFYITSSVTGDFPLFRSGQLHIRHYPEVKILGWDYNLDGDYDVAGDVDDESITLDTGSYIGYNNAVGSTASDNVDVYINVDDYDDNAQVYLFYSADGGLTSSSIATSGTAPNLTVSGLTGATLLADTLYENKKDTEGFLSWNWSVTPVGSSYIPANNYTMYVVACDGKHTSILASKGTEPLTTETINIKHSPSMRIDALTEYDTNTATPAVVDINTANVDVIMLNWGKQGIGGDSDIDDNAIISLYLDVDDAVAGVADLSSTDAASLSTAHQIVANLAENPDSKTSSYYAWDLKADFAATGWSPVAGTSYHLYAVIDENKSGGTKRVVGLGDATEPLVAGDDITEIVFTNDTYARLYDPPVDGVTLYGDQTYRMRLNAFDFDDNANLGVWVVNTNTTGFTAPATTTVAELLTANPVAPGGKVYCLTSTTGDDAAGVWLPENTTSYYDLTMRLPSETLGTRYGTDIETNPTDLIAGTYWVYIGSSVAGQPLYRAPGTITFRNVADADIPVQKNLMLTPSVFSTSLGDTMTFSVGAADGGVLVVDMIDAYIAADKSYFDVVSPSAPFTDGAGTGSLIANEVIDDTANNRWILHFTVLGTGGDLALDDDNFGSEEATFRLVSKGTSNALGASSSIYFVNEPSYATKFFNDGLQVSITTQQNTALLQPRGIIEGIVEFEGRVNSNYTVTFDLRERGSYVNVTDSVFYAQNDANPALPGVQYALDNDGKFSLFKVPSGTYDFVVMYDRYLAKKQEIKIEAGLDTLFVNFGKLLGGDCYGYTDSAGAVWPNNRIDAGDVSRISDAFLATPAHAQWNNGTSNYKWADIDESNKVDITDLTMATANFTGSNNDGAHPVWAKPAAGDNTNAVVELGGVPALLVAGQSYTVQVTISNAITVRGYYVELGYDKDAISIDNIVSGGFINEQSSCFPVSGDGMVGLANAVYGSSVFSGSGVLAEVTFTAKQSGAFAADMLGVQTAEVVNGGMLKETLAGSTSVENDIPAAFALGQNFPNPFNPTTTISFSVPNASDVTLKIYDVLGRNVRTLISGAYTPGTYSVVWDARDAHGNMVSAGTYFYSITAGNYHAAKRMLFLK